MLGRNDESDLNELKNAALAVLAAEAVVAAAIGLALALI